MIMLHLVLEMRQLPRTAPPAVGRPLFDRFCRDIDDNLREMGVGDLTVPKQMRRWPRLSTAAPRPTGRAGGRGLGALASGWPQCLRRRRPPLGAWRLAAYMREVAQSLRRA